METEKHYIPTSDGWTLAAWRVLSGASGGRSRPVAGPPVVIIPGYGMNSFIFGYHPRGRSFAQALSEAGLDVWAADLRGQGASRRGRASRRWNLADHAFRDVPAVLDHVALVTGHERVDTIGCSLGGSLLYAYAARNRPGRVRRIVAMGAPLGMVDPNLAVALVGLFGGPVARLPFSGTRPLARLALPVLARHFKDALSIYMNADLVDVADAANLSRVVEDPQVGVNLDLVRWIRSGRLVVDGMDVADALRGLDLRVLLVVARGDGIVNPPSCRSVIPVVGRDRVDELEVGDDRLHVAHADLFVSDISDERVFQPVARWLNG